jgi:hypothetical protein
MKEKSNHLVAYFELGVDQRLILSISQLDLSIVFFLLLNEVLAKSNNTVQSLQPEGILKGREVKMLRSLGVTVLFQHMLQDGDVVVVYGNDERVETPKEMIHIVKLFNEIEVEFTEDHKGVRCLLKVEQFW